VDLELVTQGFWSSKYEDDVPDRGSIGIVQSMTQHSTHVSILPTMEGGTRRKKLQEFYQEFSHTKSS
jgi:carboxymethylenebutenolidase